ncbi:hypothetical protein WDU94_010393 [Cyamophila willieti]
MKPAVILLCAFYILGSASAANRRPVRAYSSGSGPESDASVDVDVPAPAAGGGLLSGMTNMLTGGLGAVGGAVKTVGCGVGGVAVGTVKTVGGGVGGLAVGTVKTVGGGVGSLVSGTANTIGTQMSGAVQTIGSGVGSLASGAANTVDSIGAATGLGTPMSSMGAAGTTAFVNYGPGAAIRANLQLLAMDMVQRVKQTIRENVESLIARIPSHILQLILRVIAQMRAFLETTLRQAVPLSLNMGMRY